MRVRVLAVRIVLVSGAIGALSALPARAAEDAFAWAPAHAPAVVRGRESGARFGLVGLSEVDVEVDNLYDAANRQALALAEQKMAGVPGVRAVFGPAELLDITVDPSGKPSARPVLARGQSESEGEAARQRIVRRADALGGSSPRTAGASVSWWTPPIGIASSRRCRRRSATRAWAWRRRPVVSRRARSGPIRGVIGRASCRSGSPPSGPSS